MSCSLKRIKDELQQLGITSSFLEVKSMDMLIRYENANHEALQEKHGDLSELGNMFVFEKLGKKTKVRFNKSFFQEIDQLDNAIIFKEEVLSDRILEEVVEEKTVNFDSVELVEVYQGSPEIQAIGSQEQYSNYVGSIFPDSVEKRVLYHGTVSSGPRTEGFQKGVTFFTSQPEVAGGYVNQKQQMYEQETMEMQDQGVEREFDDFSPEVLPVVVDIQRPYVENEEKTYQENHETIAKLLEDDSYDAFVSDVVNDSYGQENQIAVFNNENIHALGTEKDLNMFQQYVENENQAITAESISSQENAKELQDVYDKIDAMIESNEITVSCKI